jgi:hypothetical protein
MVMLERSCCSRGCQSIETNPDSGTNMQPASKLILAVAAIAAVSAVPASARHLRHHHYSYAPYAYAPSYAPRYSQGPWYGAYAQGGFPYAPGAYHRGPDPYGVYFGGEKVGRDPDPNVRQRLQDDYSWLYSY